MSVEETIEYILHNNCSVSRYGDGEIKLCCCTDISFQKASQKLSERLREPLTKCDESFLPCIVDCFKADSNMTDNAGFHWKKHMSKYRKSWYELTDNKIVYGNAFISRPYIQYKDKSDCGHVFSLMKMIWNQRDIVIVEGEQSRLGVGNDLFDNAKSIKRVLVPLKDAFDAYEKILDECGKISKDVLILIAAGPTATVLAFDLHNKGYQAVDIGHIDVEYEWYLNKSNEKLPIKNKYVNEAGDRNIVGECNDREYLSQIITKFV